MKHLSADSMGLIHSLMPFSAEMTFSRIVNYLSFYISHSSKHFYHSPHMYSHTTLNQIFDRNFKGSIIDQKDSINIEHLFAKTLLSLHFQDHLMDQKGALRMHASLAQLKEFKKKDILEEFLKAKCTINILSGQIKAKTYLPVHQRRNIYISYGRQLPDPSTLELMITANPLYQLGNINKILIFSKSQSLNLHLPDPLEKFCNNYNIKIKLLQDSTLPTVLEFIYGRSKKKLLIHQTINQQYQLFDFLTPEEKIKKKGGKVINPLNLKLMPREIAIFGQRLPKSSVVSQDRGQVLRKMRLILGKQQDENLIAPQVNLTFDKVEKNYQHEDIQGQGKQSRNGFSVRRFVTEQVYETNREEQDQPGNPFAKE